MCDQSERCESKRARRCAAECEWLAGTPAPTQALCPRFAFLQYSESVLINKTTGAPVGYVACACTRGDGNGVLVHSS